MKDQDKRAVEAMCRCGLSLEGVIDSFPRFSAEEIKAIYESVKSNRSDVLGVPGISINCS